MCVSFYFSCCEKYYNIPKDVLECLLACVCLLFPLQDGDTPLRYAVMGGYAACVEHLVSTPGIDVNIKDGVSSCFLNRI